MGLSGKYNFKGIKKTGAAGLRLALASSPATAWILKGGFVTTFALEFFSNWLANNGLIVMNLGAYYIGGEFDQKAFDTAIDQGLKAVENSGGKLTPEQIKEIDDAVIKAADKALPYGSKPSRP